MTSIKELKNKYQIIQAAVEPINDALTKLSAKSSKTSEEQTSLLTGSKLSGEFTKLCDSFDADIAKVKPNESGILNISDFNLLNNQLSKLESSSKKLMEFGRAVLKINEEPSTKKPESEESTASTSKERRKQRRAEKKKEKEEEQEREKERKVKEGKKSSVEESEEVGTDDDEELPSDDDKLNCDIEDIPKEKRVYISDTNPKLNNFKRDKLITTQGNKNIVTKIEKLKDLDEIAALLPSVGLEHIDIGVQRSGKFDSTAIINNAIMKLWLFYSDMGLTKLDCAALLKTLGIKFAIHGPRIKPDSTITLKKREINMEEISQALGFNNKGVNQTDYDVTPSRLARIFASDASNYLYTKKIEPPLWSTSQVKELPPYYHFLSAVWIEDVRNNHKDHMLLLAFRFDKTLWLNRQNLRNQTFGIENGFFIRTWVALYQTLNNLDKIKAAYQAMFDLAIGVDSFDEDLLKTIRNILKLEESITDEDIEEIYLNTQGPSTKKKGKKKNV